MQKLLLTIAVMLVAATTAAETTKDSKLDWKFSDETIQLFAPPMEATIEQMQTWAERLEHPIPDDTEKWGGFEKYRERVARLQIDLAKQIIASKPDDQTLSYAYSKQWFAYFILAEQDKTNIPQFENFYAELKQQNDIRGRKLDRFTNNIMRTRGAVVRDLLHFDKKYIPLADELIAEYVVLLEGKPLGKEAEEFYISEWEQFAQWAERDPKYQSALVAFTKEMRELLNSRANEVETALFYTRFGSPAAPFNTPEGQAEWRAWLKQLTQRIAVAESLEDRGTLYRSKLSALEALLRNNAATDEEFLALAKEMEAEVE